MNRACITHNCNNHNTIILSCMERHLQQWALPIIMGTLCNLQGEHFLHHRRNVSKDPLISTILRRWWMVPFPLILLHLFLILYYNHHGNLFPPLLLVTRLKLSHLYYYYYPCNIALYISYIFLTFISHIIK